MSTPTTAIPVSPLAATDRCDRCGAQAYVRATLASGFDLLFCAHHWHDNEQRLRGAGAEIYDETERLSGAPKTATLDAQ